MAEAWLEDEEEELRDGAANRRHHRRANLNPATERPERNKPEHRFPGQGPLSSIRAAIKRTSRTTAQSEQQRERRRPEITIVAAEPIGPGSWFHGGPPGGLGFPPPPPPQWRPSDSHLAEPPSYEQVIKEINQVQVTTSNEPRRTSTCATQTDFPLEEEDPGPGNNVIHQPVLCDQATATVQRERPERPRQPVPFSKSNVQDGGHQITINNSAGTSTRHEDTNVPHIIRYPVPRPRTKSNLKPVGNNLSIFQGNCEAFFQATSEGELSTSQSCPGFDDHFLGDLFEMNNMSHDKSQNSITSRIRAFESQTESSEHSQRPEVAPRSINTRGGITTKPILAPKPFTNRISGEFDVGKDNKPKCPPREGLVPPILPDTSGTNRPEVPKKPKPSVIKSSSGDIPDVLLGTSVSGHKSKDPDRIMPVPAPRPMMTKKTHQAENSMPVGAKPLIPAPKFSIATQAKAFNAVEPSAARAPAQFTQSKSMGELDLISFDDDVVLPSPEIVTESNINADPFQLFSKEEAEKEQPGPPAILRKPTVIRISGKLGKSCEELPGPPPLPAEKPVGGLYNKSAARPRPTARKEWEKFDGTEESWPKPALPTRPSAVKVMETPQQPPQKGPPGRPPPPKLSKNASNRNAFPRSSSDAGLATKRNTSGINRSKSQVLRKQQPDLPPRPKPGHPLYNKYTLPLPHGLAEKDIVSSNSQELSCKRGEVLLLLEQTDPNVIHCQKGGVSGDVKVTNVKIITPLDDNVENGQKDVPHRIEDNHSPHAVVVHDFAGEQDDDLSLNSGEIVYLLEKVDHEWYKGKCRGNTGMFPANHVRIVVDIPERINLKKNSSASVIKGPRCVARFEFIGDQIDELSFSERDTIILKEYMNEEWAKGELRGHTGIFPINFVEIIEDLPAKMSDAGDSHKNKPSGTSSQQSRLSGEWCDALFDFAAEADEDLPFRKGDRILIVERMDLEWYKGRLNGREGILPAAFVQLCSGPTARHTQGGKLGKARALYDFCGENDDELSFKAGDMISMLESVDNEWMSGELHGRTGIFPKNFVQRC